MYTESLFDNILSQPDAPKLVQDLTKRLNEEQARREEFYNEIDESMKVEFINGEVIMHSPVKKMHNDANGHLFMLLRTYAYVHDLGFVGIEKIMVAFTRNDYEPDIVFFKKEKADSFTDEQTLFPVPDFVVEILSKGTQDRDRGIKMQDYESHGVSEYWIIDPVKQSVEQHILENGTYDLRMKSSNGIIKSTAIEGFEIPIEAIFNEKLNFEVLQNLSKKL